MIKVIIADDHAFVRRGVFEILEDATDMQVLQSVSTGKEFLQALQVQKFDVAVLDISMPEGGGLEILGEAQAINPQMAIIFLSIYPEKQYAQRVIQDGASGYLTKESAPDELVTAIRRAARGERYISSNLAQELASNFLDGPAPNPQEILSSREFQVIRMLGNGHTITEIAASLSLSVKTISTYKSRILEKLELRSTSDIIRYAIKEGIVV
jgi:two-component system, NarL family, invasion response regulator UvrY